MYSVYGHTNTIGKIDVLVILQVISTHRGVAWGVVEEGCVQVGEGEGGEADSAYDGSSSKSYSASISQLIRSVP